MNRLQNGEWLGMAAKGTPGGEPRLDGSSTEAGVHLRWQMAQGLGFPPNGFDLYRRNENYRKFLRCGYLREADVVGVAWDPYNYEHNDADISISFTGEVDFILGCNVAGGFVAFFRGEQELRLEFSEPVRYVRITFDERTIPNPVAEAYWQASSGPVMVGRERAQLQNSRRRISMFGDRIDFLTLSGLNMVICEVCFVLVRDGYTLGWPQIPLNGGTPVYLPVTHPEWVSPLPWSDDQAEAESRLPASLPAPKQDAYARGFQDELHSILYNLVGTAPQNLYRLRESDLDSAATLDWPGLGLLQLMAVDPYIARILGLYWHDVPPSDTTYYDYRLVAHYGDRPFPGIMVNYSNLTPGKRLGSLFENQGLTYTSPNPIDVVRTSWDGSEQTALLFRRSILAAPIAITLPPAVKSVTLRCIATLPIRFVYSGPKGLHVEDELAGEITSSYQHQDGISKIMLLTGGELTLVEIVLCEATGVVGDLIYDVYHVRASNASPVHVPALDPPFVAKAATGLDETGTLMVNQSRVDLRWRLLETGGAFLQAGAPVQFLVQREDLDEDGETVLQTTILNENAPAIISERRDDNGTNMGIENPMFSDRSVPDGFYAYAVRGIDLFGVLSEWSSSQTVEVEDHRAPPPPQSVQAHYLDPADPWLSPEDRAWAEANGPGLKLSWVWPGIFLLQAPETKPPDAEFRVYGVLGALNRLDGNVTAVSTRAGVTALSTDIHWRGGADALAGEAIRVNQNFFQVTGNTHGENCLISVQVLTDPDLAPTPGPCSLTFSRELGNWQDYNKAIHWQIRLHAEPAQEAPVVSAEVVSIDNYVDSGGGDQVMVRAGAARTVTLSQALVDSQENLLPGVLLCGGIVYPAYGHTLGNSLQVHLVPVPAPGNSSLLVEPEAGATCIYYPGQRYKVYLPGIHLEVPPGQAVAQAQIAMSAADGRPYVQDDPVWSRPGRGGLGGRLGNESGLSPAVTVQTVQRTPPPTLSSVPPVPEEPIFAQPANYYGQARYTLTWNPVPGVAGYAIYRSSGAALFDQDRVLRQGLQPPYDENNVFADDTDFAAWLAVFDPDLTGAEMITNPESHLDAWRAWGSRFYAQCSDSKIQELASLDGNQTVFRRLNPETFPATSFPDVFDGRGQGVYLYRIRTVDAAGNQSTWSPAFPPVHIFDVTPPATPVITSVTGGEKHVVLRWRANREKDLREYWVWRDPDASRLEDVRRIPATAVMQPNGAPTVVYDDEGLEGLQAYYYRLAAVDTNGNVSKPTAVIATRVIDSTPPNPPAWTTTTWVTDADGQAVYLGWQTDEALVTCIVQRRPLGGGIWIAVSDEISATAPPFNFEYFDRSADPSNAYEYRLMAKDTAGNQSTTFTVVQLWQEG